MKRSASFARKLLFLALISLVALALAEAGLRLRDRLMGRDAAQHDELRRPRYAYHPALGHALVPGYRAPASGIPFRVNALGFRGEELLPSKPEGAFRVLCLGGSTTLGTGLADPDTWPERLAALLRARHPERNLEVVNGGADGYSSAESLINLALRGVDLAPDLVIVYDGINDLRASWYPGYRSDYSHFPHLFAGRLLAAELERYQPGARLRESLLERSLLFVVLRNRIGRDGGGDPRRNGDRRLERAPEPLPVLATFERNQMSLVAVARAHRARVLLATFALLPERGWDGARKEALLSRVNPYYRPPGDLDELVSGVEALNEVTRAVAAATGAALADTARDMPHDEGLFRDECHMTAAGSARFAELVFAAVEREGLLAGTDPATAPAHSER